MWWLRNVRTANHTTLAKPEAELKQAFLFCEKHCVCYQMHLKSNSLEPIVSFDSFTRGRVSSLYYLFQHYLVGLLLAGVL